jgi:hypothetical protein
MYADKGSSKFIIYYNASDIFLGVILLVLVVFFIRDYLSHALQPYGASVYNMYQDFPDEMIKTNSYQPKP